MLFATIECTSAVSSDVEGQMYKHAKMLGITLITISLRYVACSSTHARVIVYCGSDSDAVKCAQAVPREVPHAAVDAHGRRDGQLDAHARGDGGGADGDRAGDRDAEA